MVELKLTLNWIKGGGGGIARQKVEDEVEIHKI